MRPTLRMMPLRSPSTSVSPTWGAREPQLLSANGRDTLNVILGKSYGSDDELREYMKANKTEVALAIFECQQPVTMPKYIAHAVGA